MLIHRRFFVSIAAAIFATGILSTQASAQAAPTDPQIVEIVVAANQIDINYAKLALTKAKDKQVHDFAQQMIADHGAVLKSVLALAAKLKVTPEASTSSKALKTQEQEVLKKLRAANGKAFDTAYIDNEIAYHQAVIDTVNKVLIPDSHNAELKSALTGAVPLFEGHLEHAKNVKASLK